MPVDERDWNAARVEALLATALEAAEDPNLGPDDPLPEGVQAHLRAIGAMAPGDLGGDPDGDEDEEDEDEPEVP